MNVLITTQVYLPEVQATAMMVNELAGELSRRGAKVTVATGYPHHPYGRLYPGYQKKLLTIEKENGFQVVRGWHFIHPSPSTIVRGLVMVSQCATFFLSAANCPRPDVVINYGPPLMGQLTSAVIARTAGARLVTIFYDFYPDIPIELGYLRNPLLIEGARQCESLIYRLSDRIVVLSDRFKRTMVERKMVPPEKVAVIPVWLDATDITPMSRENDWRREMGIGPEKFVVLYAGTIGLISGAEIIIEAARCLESQADILFLLVGTGHAKEEVEARVRDEGLANVRFLPFQPRERLSEMQAVADVSLVTLAPGRGRTSLPSKVLGYMAAARPVIASVDEDSDLARLISRSQCGQVLPPGRGEELAEAILACYRHPEERRRSGEAGRRYFLQHYEKNIVTRKFAELIEQLQA
jgi:colanic acid biosynthesis glycosyl transferase WcaI